MPFSVNYHAQIRVIDYFAIQVNKLQYWEKVEGWNRVRVTIPGCKHWRRAILSLGPDENVAIWQLRTFLGGGILSWKQLVVSCSQPRAFWRSFVPMQWTYSKTSCERAINSNDTFAWACIPGFFLHSLKNSRWKKLNLNYSNSQTQNLRIFRPNNRISKPLGEKSLSLAKNHFILVGEIWNSLEFRRKILIFGEITLC